MSFIDTLKPSYVVQEVPRMNIVFKTTSIESAKAEGRQRNHYTGESYVVSTVSPIWSTYDEEMAERKKKA
jgi:hypothetical protein